MSKDKAPEEKPEKAQPETQPACDPALGDLTPAFIEWFKKNSTAEEFKAKYKDRIPELQNEKGKE